MLTPKICPYCNSAFTPKNNPSQKFCSSACSNRYRRNDRPVRNRAACTCEQCGKIFETMQSRQRRFCCYQCSIEFAEGKPQGKRSEYTALTCAQCGKSFEVLTSYHQIRPNVKFCSRRCRADSQCGSGNHMYRGGTTTYRGSNWRQVSKQVLKRDGSECQCCHKQVALKKFDYAVHHIRPYKTFNGDFIAANQLSNLITLCRKCHGLVETGRVSCPMPQ